MKLKYYLRGMGIGIILTAIVMGFALGGRKATISDAEVIRRAKELGMIEAGTGVLTQSQLQTEQINEKEDSSSSDTPLGKTGEKIPEEVNEELSGADNSVSDVAGETQETQTPSAEEGRDENESSDDDAQGKAKETVKETETASNAEVQESTETQESANTQESAEVETASNNDNTEAVQTASASQAQGINTTDKTVTIPGGLGSEGVAAVLVREGIIADASSFNKYLVDNRIDRIIRSGIKTIPAGASYEQIANIITR